MKIAAGVIFLTMLAGCAAPSGTGYGGTISNDDFGEPPGDSDVADAIAKGWFNSRLKDPYSAVIKRVGGPSRFTKKGSLFGPSSYGWGLCYTINAKNSFGGYTGARPVFFVVREGRIIDVLGGVEGNSIDTALARSACQNIGAAV